MKKFSSAIPNTLSLAALQLRLSRLVTVIFLTTGVLLVYLACLLSMNAQRPHLDHAISGWRPMRHRETLHDAMNRTFGFQKLFVLSMPERVDKHDLWSMAAYYTDIDFEYIDGVRGDLMPPRARPAGWDDNQSNQTLGCFRGHANFWRKMIDDNIQSALILEDDADWDVNIKQQMLGFARGSRYLLNGGAVTGSLSPYGDDWDLLWLGTCGISNRFKEDNSYYVIRDDPTVLPHRHRIRDRQPKTSSSKLQGNYTRLIYEPYHGMCSTSYAISLRGAQKLLYHYSLEPSATVLDWALSIFCEMKLSKARCVTTWPSLFQSYRAPGSTSRDSDRENSGDNSFRKVGFTPGLVFPMRPNLGRFVQGNESDIPSAIPGDSMFDAIDYRTLQYPIGQGVFVTEAEMLAAPEHWG